MEVGMSYSEKGAWVQLVVSIGAYAAYLAVVLGRAGSVPLAEVAYVTPMLWAVGIGIGGSIVGRILVEIARPSESTKNDVRDKDINRSGEYVGGMVLGYAMVGPFALALAQADHFWITNAMYAAFFLGSLVSTSLKLVAYRRGI
jgi:hypothetical protein